MPDTGDEAAAERLGRFVANASAETIPAPLIHEAKRSVLNIFGTALGVASEPPIAAAVRALRDVAGDGAASLIGRPERLDMMSAAFCNAVAANLLDYDDTHLATVIHPAAPVAPPALALAERHGFSGRAVLEAFVLGAEVECRIGNAVSPGHYARGWHITSTCGVFGAAAACSKLLGLPADRTAHALGIAASQSAGLVENLPTGGKNVSVGNAARNGLFAALLAREGYTAAPRSIEGPLGWARAMGDVPKVAEITDGLGLRWQFAKTTYKPYPCGIVMHSVIDACFEIRNAHGIAADEIASVVVRGDALLLARGDRAVRNERDAQVSIHHCVASVFLHGAAGVPQFARDAVMAPDAAAFRAKVTAALAPDMPVGAAEVVVTTVGGGVHRATVVDAKGSMALPLTDGEIEAKVRDSAGRGSPGCDVDKVIAAAWALDAAADVRGLMAAARA